MPERVATRRTTYGWLAWLASIGFGDPDLALVAEHCPLPVASIDLRARRMVTPTPQMVALLGLGSDDLSAPDLHLLVEDPLLLDTLFDLLIDGSMDAYESRGSLRRSDGDSLEVRTWTVVTREERQRALFVVVPVGEGVRFHPPEPSAAEWLTAGYDVTMGFINPTLEVRRVSPDIEQLLGLPAEHAIGTSLTELLHPDDVSSFGAVVSQTQANLASAGLVVRMRHRRGHWIRVHIILAPLSQASVEQPTAFAFSIASLDSPARAQRISSLEGHLRRIAQEVEDAGLALGLELDAPVETIPGLSDFSIRQLEVLRHLTRGERVPGIATAMSVSQSTVRNHLSEMFRKVGVHSQGELLALLRVADPGSDR
jgi:PAS domain S-box-containing protein